jgi:RHS repeat-associated protein
MERDDEVKTKRNIGGGIIIGKGNSYDYGARFYDPRAARWFSRDPSADLTPSLSPFVMASNNPIFRVDRDGRKDAIYHANDLSEDLEAYDIGFVEKTLLTSGMYLVDILLIMLSTLCTIFDNLIGFDQIQMNYKNLYTNFYQNDATALSTVNERMIFLATLHAFQDFYHHSNYVELYIEWYQSKYSNISSYRSC